MLNEIHYRKAPARLSSYDAATGEFEAVLATDIPVRMGDLWEALPCRADAVNLERMPLPIQRDHKRGTENSLGNWIRVWFANGEMLGRGKLNDRARDTYGRDMQAGLTFGVSVGYEIANSTMSKRADGSRERVVTRWTPMEASLGVDDPAP